MHSPRGTSIKASPLAATFALPAIGRKPHGYPQQEGELPAFDYLRAGLSISVIAF